jgi:hypothetical protein
VPKRYKRRRGGKLFFLILCLAGLGLGVWLFGKRGAEPGWDGRASQNGS